jgi:hypothetical protein
MKIFVMITLNVLSVDVISTEYVNDRLKYIEKSLF